MHTVLEIYSFLLYFWKQKKKNYEWLLLSCESFLCISHATDTAKHNWSCSFLSLIARYLFHAQGGKLCSSNTNSFSCFLCGLALSSWKLLIVDSASVESLFFSSPSWNVPQMKTQVLNLTKQRQGREDEGEGNGVSWDKNGNTYLCPGYWGGDSEEAGFLAGLGLVVLDVASCCECRGKGIFALQTLALSFSNRKFS